MMAESPTDRSSDYLVLSVQPLGGRALVPIALLLFDAERDRLYYRFRSDILDVIDPEERDVMSAMPQHLIQLEAEQGGSQLLRWMEDTLSNYIQISERYKVPTPENWIECLDKLFLKCIPENARTINAFPASNPYGGIS